MLMYIAATNQVVSIVLVMEHAKEGKIHRVQRSIYYFSKVFTPTKQRTRTTRS